MPRRPDPERKPQLIADILDHLQDKPLASVSFRSIAQSLGFSTYTLVYHFGTRSNMLSEIVAAASTRVSGIEATLTAEPPTLEAYIASLEASWTWTLEPRNRQLQRIEFEAALIEAVQPEQHTFTRELFATWLRIGTDALITLGLSAEAAALETRLIVDAFFGIQFDYVLNNDAAGATAAFERSIVLHRRRLGELLTA